VSRANRSRSTKSPPCLPPVKSKTRARVSKRLNIGFSKINPISPRWDTQTSPWRTTRTTKGRLWPVAHVGPKPRAKEHPTNLSRPNPTCLPPSLCGGSLKASRPLIRVMVINDNHWGLTFLLRYKNRLVRWKDELMGYEKGWLVCHVL
jgi:hypothetical protein